MKSIRMWLSRCEGERVNTALMAKIDILLNLINFANDMLNESIPPTTSYSLMRRYSNNDNYLKKALGIKNEH